MRVQRSRTRAGTAGDSRSGWGRGRRPRGLPARGAPGAGSGEAARGGGGARGAEPGPSGLPGVGGVWVRAAAPRRLSGPPRKPRAARGPGRLERRAGGARGPGLGSAPPYPERRGRDPAGPEEAVTAVPAAGEASRGCPRASAPPSSPAGWHASRRGPGGAGSPRAGRALLGERRARHEPAGPGFTQVARALPGFAGSPRPASALLGAPVARWPLGTGFGLQHPAARPGWPFRFFLFFFFFWNLGHIAVSSSFVKMGLIISACGWNKCRCA